MTDTQQKPAVKQRYIARHTVIDGHQSLHIAPCSQGMIDERNPQNDCHYS